jgi:predicted Zn-dependent protease
MKPYIRYISVAVMAVVVVTLLPGCCTDPVNGESYLCLANMSEADEIALGQQYAPTFRAESGGAYPDPELHATLEDIVINKMAKKSHRGQLPWEFTILNTSDINAFAVPGGQVFVTRGLLARLDSEAQFAQLMGHEIGHVSHRHSVRGQNRQVLFGVAVAAVGVAADQVFDPDEENILRTVTLAGAGLASSLTFLKFSRDQELQSDRLGIDYAFAAGYDPREAKKTFEMFRSMKEDAGQSEGLIAGLLSTHPLDSNRIEQIDEYVAENYPDVAGNSANNLVVSSPRWSASLNRLKRAQPVYERYDEAMAMIASAADKKDLASLDSAETILRECIKKLPGHAVFHTGLGTLDMERDDLNAAERDFGEAARLDPDNFVARFYSGIIHMEKKRVAEATTELHSAHLLHPLHPLPCLFLGRLFKDQGNVDQARTWFTSTLERSPRDSDIRREARAELEAMGAGAGGDPA